MNGNGLEVELPTWAKTLAWLEPTVMLFFGVTAGGTAIIMIAWAIDNAREILRRRRSLLQPPVNPTIPEHIPSGRAPEENPPKGARSRRWWPWVLAGGIALGATQIRLDLDGILEAVEKVARELQSRSAQLARELSETARRIGAGAERHDLPDRTGQETAAVPTPPKQHARFGRCKPTRVVLRTTWVAPQFFEYFAAYPRRPSRRRPQNSILGLHYSSGKTDVKVQTKTTCRGDQCQVCITRVLGEFGFRPSRITLREDLRSNRCVQSRMLLHEQRHAAVTREAEKIAIRRAHYYLRWTKNHGGIVVDRGDEKSGKAHAYQGVRNDLRRAMEDAKAYARRQNNFIDSDAEHRREWRETRRLCGKTSWR